MRSPGRAPHTRPAHAALPVRNGPALPRAHLEWLLRGPRCSRPGEHEAWLAGLTPAEREDEEGHWAQMAAADPHDPYENKYQFEDPYEDEPATKEDGYGPQDEYDDADDWDGDRW